MQPTKLEWSDQYVLIVLVLMVALYCTRGVVETVLGVLTCIESCVGINICENCAYRNSLQLLARMLLDVYFGLHPTLLILVVVLVQQSAEPRPSSTLLCSMVLSNATAHYTHPELPPTLDARSRVDEVEYIMWTMPMALAMSASYMFLSRAFACQDLTEQSEWSEDILDGSVFVYEMAYHLELFLMNLSLIGTSCSEQSLGLVVYASATVTLIQAYFVASSRMAMDSQPHAVLSMLVAALFVLVLVSLLAYVHACILSQILGLLLVVSACVVVLGHHSSFGRARVSQIVVLRLGVVAVVSLTHIVVMCIGRNRVCNV